MTLEKPNNAWTKLAFVNLDDLVIEFIEPSDKGKAAIGLAGVINHVAIKVKNLDGIFQGLRNKGVAFESEKPVVNDLPYLIECIENLMGKGNILI
jgi:hypothetical protein